MTRLPATRRSFTLVEVVLAMVIMTILMGGMASAIVLASRVLPDDNHPVTLQRMATTTAADLAAELATATRIISSSARMIEFQVPDRGHGAAGPETIRYEWSGTPLDPIERTYNGGSPVTVATQVTAFDLALQTDVRRLQGLPRVAMFTDALDAPVTARQSLLESWGFEVDVILSTDTAGDTVTAATTADVHYFLLDIWFADGAILSNLGASSTLNLARGAVIEHGELLKDYGLSSGFTVLLANSSTVQVADDTHVITAAFPTGNLMIGSSALPLLNATGKASGGQTLVTYSAADNLTVHEIHSTTTNGTAAARRVKLPWADATFYVNDLNDEGKTLLRRSLIWAAAPVCYARASVTLQCGAETSGQVQTEVHLLNMPRVEGL